MDLPEPSYEQGFEDTQSVENNIDTLYSKFILPIENIRSISEAPLGILQSNSKNNVLANLKFDSVLPMESRVSAFYRMLGLPVVDKNGNFYNPGFNPNRSSEEKRDQINSNIDSSDLALLSYREIHAKFMRTIFSRQDLAASVLSLLMGAQPKKFNVFDKEDQTYKIQERAEELSVIKKNNPNLESSIDAALQQFSSTIIGSSADGGSHILKPFIVDPAIDFTVMPTNNKICVPFLRDQAATKLSSSPDVFLLRPGIEFIIRARLKDNVPDKSFLKDLENILTQQKQPSQTPITSADALFSTIVALADQNNIENVDLKEIFGNFSSTQAIVVRQLIRAIKNVIEQLHFSMTELDKVREVINFLPQPSTSGPEKIGKILETTAKSQIDTSIIQLNIKKLNAEREIAIREGLGQFATPFVNLDRVNVYDQQLQSLTSLKNDLGKKGLEHLRKIEIITGEVSGLGLIDILAIYTALWSIDIKSLLGLLDADSFKRLYDYNVDLRTSEVVNNQKENVKTSLSNLESSISNILSFADFILSISLSSPQEAIRGEPV